MNYPSLQKINTILQTNSINFDDQAHNFDERVGLPPEYCSKIAQAVLSISGTQTGELVVEVGVGTGAIAKWIGIKNVQYVGFDISKNMLALCSQRIHLNSKNALLVQADGNKIWPFANKTVKTIFGSRVLHLFPIEHVISEIYRITHDQNAHVVLGRIHRSSQSIKTMLRKELLRLLETFGMPGRDGGQNQKMLLKMFHERGAQIIDPVLVSSWTVWSTPRDSIDTWREKNGLAGINLPFKIKKWILGDLEKFANKSFGGLDHPHKYEESYILQGIVLS